MILLAVLCCFTSLLGQEQPGGPTSEKARKTFRETVRFEAKHETFWALDRYKKADKQDGGRCVADQMKMIRYGIDQGDWKAAETAAAEPVGTRISMDELQGKVVLLDFWATWCGACREALPHIKEMVKRFQGQPLVVPSVSLDTDEGQWKEFVSKSGMSWPQVRDGGFEGTMAKLFGV